MIPQTPIGLRSSVGHSTAAWRSAASKKVAIGVNATMYKAILQFFA